MRVGALLDDISSTRSSTTRQSQALDEIEQALAMACTSSDKEGQLDAFLMLQDAFETNVASRLVAVISSWLPLLQYRAGDQCQCNASGPNLEVTILNIVRVLSILQGISLLHKPSQLFLGRRWCLELFLDLLALSRQLHQSADFSTRQEIISSLASAVLDILPCILVDTPESIRHFEQASGLEIVVRTLKRASVPREIRMKCLEFLYFYLLPEDGIIPIGPTLPLSEIPSQPKLETTSDGWEISSGRSDSSEETYMPNPKVAELHLLKQELSFVPITPKKPLQVAPQRTGSPLERKGRRSPTRTLQAQPPNHAPSEQSIGRTHESAAQRTPYRRHMREESAATLVGIFLVILCYFMTSRFLTWTQPHRPFAQMTEGTSKKADSDPPPSYAAATRAGTSAGTSVPTTSNGPNHVYRGPEDTTVLVALPQLDPRSHAARTAARNRAVIRFMEALLWAIVIQLIAAAIIGGSIWPEHSRHWIKYFWKDEY
ncbi:hypothetical protein FRB91_006540 [Serendipita sp. 411]|nr:hypothetical protein FRB91_006540 [Serendipita sp. 411]